MKRFSLILLMLAGALALSCTREPSPEHDSSEAGFKTIHYKVQVSSSGISKATTAENDTKYVFQATDVLYVSSTNPDSGDVQLFGVLTLIYGSGETTAYFEGDLVGVNEFEPDSDTPINVTLVSSEDRIHTTSEGQLTDTSYPSGEYGTTLADAVEKYSNFTCSTTFGTTRFTLTQQSAFLVFSVKFLATEVASGTSVTASIKNDINSTNVTLMSGSVSATTLGADHTQVVFVAAFPGGTTSLSDAELSLTWGANPEDQKRFDINNANLAANNYYTVSRRSFTYDGFRIKPATEETTTVTFNYNYENSGIEYSTDEGVTWTQYSSGAITLPADGICVRGTRNNYKNGDGTPGSNILFTSNNKKCYISGNIMSLLNDKENISESAFQGTFSKGNTAVNYIDINPSDPLILPDMTLAANCYSQMFMKCTGLTSIPGNLLPATSLAASCYSQMFKGCTGLTSLPTTLLPATTLSESCYESMFEGCTALTTASSILPQISTVGNSACLKMFYGCTSLTTAPALSFTTVNAYGCMQMFMNCSALTTPPSSLPATTLGEQAYYQMFYGCSAMTTPPSSLPATTIGAKAYYQMFMNCTGLTSTPSFPGQKGSLSGIQICYQMFNECTALTTTSGKLFTDDTELTEECFHGMFRHCSSLADVPGDFLPSIHLAKWCYRGMFEGAAFTTAPDLPATTLVNECYRFMFNSCSNLNYIKCLAENPNRGSFTPNWVAGGVPSSDGTFIKSSLTTVNSGTNLTQWLKGNNGNGIPNNWTVKNDGE